jgi:dolichyl-phosphate beta-glucosyltransferase
MNSIKLSIVVPAYNEEKKITESLSKFNSYLSRQNYEYEIVVVNDGSTDNTRQCVLDLTGKIKNLRLINNEKNSGKGAAIRLGLLSATGQYRLFIDADNATGIEHIDLLWPYFKNGFEVIIGSRNKKDADGACQAKPQPLWKRCLGILGNKIIRVLTVRGIRDTQCGFKAFTDKTVEAIIKKTIINRWGIDIEILAIAKKLNYKIGIIPVVWNNSPASRVGLKGYLYTLKDIFIIKWKFIKGDY